MVSLQTQMNQVRAKRAFAILFQKKTHHTLDRGEREFLWEFLKKYQEAQEFLLVCGQSFHKQVWLRASGALAQIEANPGYYYSLKRLALDYPNPAFSQIEIDVIRSFS